ncbi:hypothetical protein [Crenothrix polyspora]|uniref:Outer membrane efflux protein n=1 Tax=Crenothrix polyspora TaxID=360316 RepID=A0A1R4H628_9GAMM|nr:hypothetical protein [Crenothrix polyspora]SJM91715.1 exported hypothetical protein [Crenothrix polyspora]
MKALLPIVFCLLSVTAVAEDIYMPPKIMTDAEVRQAEIDMEKSRLAISYHWRTRLAIAQEKARQQAEIDATLNKSSDADVGHKH